MKVILASLSVLVLANNAAFAMLPNPDITTTSLTLPNQTVPLIFNAEGNISTKKTYSSSPSSLDFTPQNIVHQISQTPNQPQEAISHQNNQDLKEVITAHLVKDNNLVAVDGNTVIAQGDVIEYHTHLTNTTTERIRQAVVVLSIPNGTELVGTISPSAMGSVDGQKFTQIPLKTRVNGQLQDIPLMHYKALKWTVDNIGIGGTAIIKYQVKIN